MVITLNRIIISLIILILFLSNNSFPRENTIRISKDKINGIYRVYNIFDKSLMSYYAICGNNSYKYKIAIKSLNYDFVPQKNASEPKAVEIKYNVRSWSPSSEDFVFYGVKNKLSYSIKVQEIEIPTIVIYYLRIEKDIISVAEFIIDNDDYETSLFGQKEFEEFNIIDEKTNKIIEICKSR